MLIEASWTAIKKNSRLLLYYKKHAAANNKHAIMKVARKLALHGGVGLKNKPYDGDCMAVKQKQAQPPHDVKQDNKTVFKA